MANGSSPPVFIIVATNEPLHNGQDGLWDFQAVMHWEWKYFLQVEQSYNGSVYLSIYVKQITQSVSSFKSISFESLLALF